MKSTNTNQNSLGPLQQAVLDCIYEQPGCSVRAVLDKLNTRGGSYAYTTVQTVCDALHDKRLVLRKREKLAYHYTARSSKSGVLAQAFSGLLSKFGADPRPVASSLVDVLETDAPEQLEALIAELRQRGKL